MFECSKTKSVQHVLHTHSCDGKPGNPALANCILQTCFFLNPILAPFVSCLVFIVECKYSILVYIMQLLIFNENWYWKSYLRILKMALTKWKLSDLERQHSADLDTSGSVSMIQSYIYISAKNKMQCACLKELDSNNNPIKELCKHYYK